MSRAVGSAVVGRVAVVLAAALVALACGAASPMHADAAAAAGTGLTWASATTIDPHSEGAGRTILGLACPTASQCTAVDADGQAVTFNPAAPSTAAPVFVDSGHSLQSVSCPIAAQCTAVDDGGREVTFNPASPGNPTAVEVAANSLGDVVCPSASQCTAVGSRFEVTFDPTSPGSSTPVALTPPNAQSLTAVACASATECVAVGSGNVEVTFNPLSVGSPTPIYFTDSGAAPDFTDIACPSTTQCTAVDGGGSSEGDEVTFNPLAPDTSAPLVDVPIIQSPLGIACPGVSQCTVVGGKSEEVTFDPAGKMPATSTVASSSGEGAAAVACPSASECVLAGSGQEAAFNPTAPGSPVPAAGVGDGGAVPAVSISCPAATQCTAVDFNDDEVTFDPSQLKTLGGGSLYLGHDNVVACPTTSQCTVFNGGGVMTFDPLSPGTPTRTYINNYVVLGLACPTTSQCTGVDQAGRAVTFDPSAPLGRVTTPVDTGHQLVAIVCPTATQCTAVDNAGREVTFDPVAVGTPSPVTVDSAALVGLACPSATQCTAVDAADSEVTFNPASVGTPSPVMIDSLDGTTVSLTGVGCTSTTQCIAVDDLGREIPFAPSSPAGADPVAFDSRGLVGVSCPSASECVAIDAAFAYAFDPPSAGVPVSAEIDSAGALVGVSCPLVTQCTALDGGGQAITYNPNAPGTPTPHTFGGHLFSPVGVSCPTAAECVSAGLQGDVISFNPVSPAGAHRESIDAPDHGLAAIACPSAHQCTALDRGDSLEYTFDPTASGGVQSHQIGISINGLISLALACPTVTLCVGVGGQGAVTVFNPRSPAQQRSVRTDPSQSVRAVSCFSARQCTTVDDLGSALTFNPSGSLANLPVEHSVGGAPLYGVGCPLSNLCIAVDVDGDAFAGNPRTDNWSRRRIAGARGLGAVSCAPTQCVVVDSYGHTSRASLPVAQLTVNVSGAKGRVAISPSGKACSAACREYDLIGTVVTVTAHPASGKRFVRWSGLQCHSTKKICTFSMHSPAVVTAKFGPA